MGAKNFYDAVLVGLDLTTLLAGALLSKRGFRVLLVGQSQPWPSYGVRGFRLPRAPFTLTSRESPALGRVFSELALRPLLQRRIRPLSPAFQAVMPGHRLDVGRDLRALGYELEREFPAQRRAFEALWHRARAGDVHVDALVARDLTWPPGGFFERREFARAMLHAPLGSGREAASTGLSPDDPLRHALDARLALVAGGSLEPTTPRTLRVLSGLLSAAALEDGGLESLYELLLESIRTHNGSVRLHGRVESLHITRRTLESLIVQPSDEQVGCHYLLWGLPIGALGMLLEGTGDLTPMFEEVGSPTPVASRFTLNLVLRAAGLPEGMARNVLLQGEPPLWVEAEPLGDGLRARVTLETLLPVAAGEERAKVPDDQRARMLRALSLLSPFFREHLELVDSPHDGRPPEDPRDGATLPVDEAVRRGPETMETLFALARPRLSDTCALPVRTPIKRILLCNPQVVHGLALEGQFLTAWSAARVVTRSLSRDWMNRGRWTKVEI